MRHDSFRQAYILNSNSAPPKKSLFRNSLLQKSQNFNLSVKRVNLYKLEWLVIFLKIFIKPTNLD